MSVEGLGAEPGGTGGAWLPFVASPSLVPNLLREPRNGPSALLGPAVMPRAIPSPTILVFDSGLGGLTVYREVAQARPDARFIYAADDAVFPYGRLTEGELVCRVVAVIGKLIAAHQPDLVVIACNTASTIALPALRAHFDVPFVGTVPAIKPACAASASRLVSVLGTEATVKREYTRSLIREFAAGCNITLVGSPQLATVAERHLRGEPVSDLVIAEEIAPCFVSEGRGHTDMIVLACTHYPLLLDRLEYLAPWPVTFLDPAPAIARRVLELIGPPAARQAARPTQAVFTSGCAPMPGLAAALARFGIGDITADPFDTPHLSA